MKVLQVNTTDRPLRGTEVAMHRLHSGLRKVGVDSKILCDQKTLVSPHVVQISRSKHARKAESLLQKATSRLGLNSVHCVSSFEIKKSKTYLEADVLNLHCIHSGFFNYLALPSLTKDKPAVYTLHDVWPFTGHCSVSYSCERWKTGCGQCPHLDSFPTVKKDNTRIEWNLKKWVYSRSNLAIVTPSTWMTEQAKQSILKELPIYHIPHGIDTEVYQPLDREQCRLMLDIPLGKKVLMFAAAKLRLFGKGGDLLLKALQSLPDSLKAETVLLMFGEDNGSIAEAAGLQTISLGSIHSDRLKAIAYSAADVFLFPTRAESFGLVALESLACGTPVISFKVGGVPDLVRPGFTGYLAEPENFADFRDGIVQLLEDTALRESMGREGRAVAVQEFPIERQVQQYFELYQQLLERRAA